MHDVFRVNQLLTTAASTDLLNIDTPIIITPDPSPPNNTDTSTQQLQLQQQQQQHQPSHSTPTYPIRSYGDALYTDLFDAQRIDFSFLDNNKPPPSAPPHHHPPPKKPTPPPSDPLPDTLFSPA